MRTMVCALLISGLSILVGTAQAAIVTYDYTIEFSGATPPAGAAPWLRATFDDGGGSGSVVLTFEGMNLVGSEFVRFVYFNLDPALDPTSLVFSGPTKSGVFDDPAIATGVNAFQADGDGLYDIQMTFALAPTDSRFDGSDSVMYTITGIPTLTANSFDFFSAPAGGNGPFPTAAHVQGIGPLGENSGWVTHVPEPAALGFVGLISLTLVRRPRDRA